MGLESGNTVASLNANWPLGTDPKSQGDDHIRLIKQVLQADVRTKAAVAANATAIITTAEPLTTSYAAMQLLENFVATSTRVMVFGELRCNATGGPGYVSSSLGLYLQSNGVLQFSDNVSQSTLVAAPAGSGGIIGINHAVLVPVQPGIAYYFQLSALASANGIFTRNKAVLTAFCL